MWNETEHAAAFCALYMSDSTHERKVHLAPRLTPECFKAGVVPARITRVGFPQRIFKGFFQKEPIIGFHSIGA